MLIISQIIEFSINQPNRHNTLLSRLPPHCLLNFLHNLTGFMRKDPISITANILLPFLQRQIIKFTMPDSPHYVPCMLGEESGSHIPLSLVQQLKVGDIFHQAVEELANVEFPLNDCVISIEDLLQRFLLQSFGCRVACCLGWTGSCGQAVLSRSAEGLAAGPGGEIKHQNIGNKSCLYGGGVVVIPETELLELFDAHPPPLNGIATPLDKLANVLILNSRQLFLIYLQSLHHFQQNLLILILPWSTAKYHLIADHSQSKQVCFCRVVGALQGLRCHIGRRTDIDIPDQILLPNNRKTKITDLPCIPRLEYICWFEIAMQYLLLQQIPITRDNLLHYCHYCTLSQLIVLLYEVLQCPLGAVFQNKVIEVAFFDDAMALDNVGVVQLLVHLHLLLQKCQILLLPPDLALINYLDCEQLPGVS